VGQYLYYDSHFQEGQKYPENHTRTIMKDGIGTTSGLQKIPQLGCVELIWDIYTGLGPFMNHFDIENGIV
jgi:hypothetical protein